MAISPTMHDASQNRSLTLLALGASFPLGIHLVHVNLQQLATRPSSRHTIALAIASLCQVINQLFFTLLFTIQGQNLFVSTMQDADPITRCRLASDMSDVFYGLFQLLSTSVLILRSTRLLPVFAPTWSFTRRCCRSAMAMQYSIRLILTCLFAIGTFFVVLSCVLKDMSLDPINGTCQPKYQTQLNGIGKVMYFGVYLLVLVVFTGPATIHLRRVRAQSNARKHAPAAALQIAPPVADQPDREDPPQRLPGIDERGEQAAEEAGSSGNGTSFGRDDAPPAFDAREEEQHQLQHPEHLRRQQPRSPDPVRRPVARRRSSVSAVPQPRNVSLNRALSEVVETTALSIVFAILAYLVSATLSFVGIWESAIIEFSFENYAAMYAATYSAVRPMARATEQTTDERPARWWKVFGRWTWIRLVGVGTITLPEGISRRPRLGANGSPRGRSEQARRTAPVNTRTAAATPPTHPYLSVREIRRFVSSRRTASNTRVVGSTPPTTAGASTRRTN